MACGLCHGLNGPRPSSFVFKQQINTTLGCLEASARGGCGYCDLFSQSVSPYMADEHLEPGQEIHCTISKYDTDDVCISLSWGDRSGYDPQRIISVYLEKDSKRNVAADVLPMRKHIIQDPGGKDAMEVVQTWLEKCATEHDACARPHTAAKLPSRVIDVGALHCAEQPKLVETMGATGSYVALSHCWGKTQIITTKRDTLKECKQGIQWSSLSKTFQDAILVTRQLQVRYIWIDSLCIVQDDAEDWETESTKMGSIYENAYLTIAATASSSGDQGLFKQRPAPHALRFWDPSNSTQEQPRIFAQALPSHDGFTRRNHPDPSDNPLLSRAWVYQERILSTRIVHFGSKELVWECKTAYECECAGIGRYMNPWSRPASFKQDYAIALEDATPGASLWEDMVREYTACALTFEKDRLSALAATARRLHGRLGTYYAGLWLVTLPGSLFWQGDANEFENPGGAMVDPGHHWKPGTRSTAKHCPPSWSWASLERCVINIWHGFDETWLRVLEASVAPMLHDPFGIVAEGHLKLSGPLVQLNYSVAYGQGERYAHYVLERDSVVKTCFPDVSINDDGLGDSNAEIYGLIGGLPKNRTDSVHVLIVKRRVSERGIFERVGVVPYGPLEWRRCAKEATLILV